jgi:hypothetical protein
MFEGLAPLAESDDVVAVAARSVDH